ncbi:hypothetical protein LDL08_01380 [Nonomuraea glycinis]|uniref:Uncharacterized protein n=1 Tax=Nonomuraea glycinis TaxID=2047744 RepID=A0A918A177_9ACTN|nr:hypothetical protein [Nonomuraea glycinis]MCA2174829.1 hypothetical protein [Nonomuraea glycinis]GGP01577.1 hypothetical protein GCM10012278_05370 [Nonomuraea glycinis]
MKAGGHGALIATQQRMRVRLGLEETRDQERLVGAQCGGDLFLVAPLAEPGGEDLGSAPVEQALEGAAGVEGRVAALGELGAGRELPGFDSADQGLAEVDFVGELSLGQGCPLPVVAELSAPYRLW